MFKSDAIVIVTKHKDYNNLDFYKLNVKMRTKVIIDGRNIYNQKEIEQLGFTYKGIGKPR